MLWHKEKFLVRIRGGKGVIRSAPLHGLIAHLIVYPANLDAVFSMAILDRDGDRIFEVKDHRGRLDDRGGIPVGRDSSERVQIVFDEVSLNCEFTLILKLREMQ